eukprot:TRINITY_DN699_c0_g1_i9.p1 TRINITY_DN699_c0_g1~~TRINITY_DN699_c0_g1_i9.p1  ORF type:complete len:855 (-),score=333.77 TRINITY_DN699_c0_g1_i9:376-2940(-)
MSFVELVQYAAFSNDNNIRGPAEKKLLELREADPQAFLISAAQEFANEQLAGNLRLALATLLSQAAIAKVQTNTLWFAIEANIKQSIKRVALQALVAPDNDTRKGAAEVISTICSLELPRNEWSEIIPALVENTNSNDPTIKKAAIMTLGYICEKSKNTGGLSPEQIDKILMGICLSMQKTQTDNHIKATAVKALQNSLAFMEENFKADQVRDFVMNLLLENCVADHPDVQIISLQCLIDICKIHYDKIGNYLNGIYNVTSGTMASNTQEVAIPAIEVWNTIAQEDKDRSDDAGKHLENKQVIHYVTQVHLQLVPILLQNLLKADGAEEEFSIQAASFRCLSSISEVVGDGVIDNVWAFVHNFLNSANQKEKLAAILAFTSIVDGPSADKIDPIIMTALPLLIQLLADSKDKIREAIAMMFARVAEFHPEVFLNGQSLMQVVPLLVQALTLAPRISIHFCWMFDHLAIASASIQDQHVYSAWTMTLDKLMDALIQNAYRDDVGEQKMVIGLSFVAVVDIIHNSKNPAFLDKYLRTFITLFKNALTFGPEKRQTYLCSISTCIQTCVQQLRNKVEDALVREIYLMYIEYFKFIKDVDADGFQVICALCFSIEGRFVNFVEDFWQYLNHAMTKTNEPELFKTCLGLFAEIGRACGDAFQRYLPTVVPYLLNCLNTPNYDREVKLNIFLCIGDMALGCNQHLAPFLPEIMKFYEMAYDAALQLSENEPSEYTEQLKEKLVESFICILHAFVDTPFQENVLTYIPKTIEFLQRTCNTKYNPTVEYLRSSLALIVDIAHIYGAKVRDLVRIPLTNDLVTILTRFKDYPDNARILDYAHRVLANFQSVQQAIFVQINKFP